MTPLPTYRTWKPSLYDTAGLGCPDRQDWLVAPVLVTRDAACIDRSNWAVVLADLGDDPDNSEVHRFNHWGPGWFEIILCRPGSLAAVKAQHWADQLADYPIASDDHFYELETIEAGEYWAGMSLANRVQLCQRFWVNIFAARRAWPPDDRALEEYLHRD